MVITKELHKSYTKCYKAIPLRFSTDFELRKAHI